MNLKTYLSYLIFYARIAIVGVVALVGKCLSLILPTAWKRRLEVTLLSCCNRLFRRMVPVEPFLDRDSYYDYLDTADFRTLCRKLNIEDNWFHGKSILDVGCGHGKLARKLAASGADKVEGIDISQTAIDYANKLQEAEPVESLKLRIGSVYDLDFPDKYFDIVVSQVVFEHLDDIPLALSEIKRVMKPGGLFYFTIDSFRTRYGAHMGHYITVPWPLVFFSEEACKEVWLSAHEETKKMTPTGDVPDYFQWYMGLPGINRIALCRLEEIIAESGLSLQNSFDFADEQPLKRLFPFIKNFPNLYEYIRGSKAYLLRKDEAPLEKTS